MDDRISRDQEVLDRLRQICGAFDGCEEGVLQDRPLFHVNRRRFAIFNGEASPRGHAGLEPDARSTS